MGPTSTTWPPYMTMTRWAIWATTPRSWLTKAMAIPKLSCSPASSPSISAWIVTSRAVVGSSAIKISGSQAKAMAIMARWRIPPENSCG